ncbi:MAG: TetR/AcrR family transcriptional regulator [Planctomycetes bacterium]|nr:TetR/AcrR family transcriptional regulator [Planctomycetota bacterium]
MNGVDKNTLWPMGRAQRRAGKTRMKLLDAALAVFTEIGVDAASIEKITERADVGKGTFYRHFADKRSLLQALIEEAIEKLNVRITDDAETPGGFETRLERLFDEHVNFFLQYPRQYILLFQGRMFIKLGRDLTGEIEAPYLRYLETLERQMATFLPDGMQPTKIRGLSCAIAGFVFGFFSFAMIGLTKEEIEESLRPVRKAFVDSMAKFLAR